MKSNIISNSNKIDKVYIINSVLVGLLIMSNFIVDAISSTITIDALFAIFVSLLGFFFVVNNSFHKGKRRANNIDLRLLLFSFFFLIQALFGFIVLNTNSSRQFLLSFLTIGLSGLICGYQKIDITIVCKTIVIVTLMLCKHIIDIISMGSFAIDAGLQMGIAYSVLPIIIFGLISIFNKNETFIFRFLSLLSTVLSLAVVFRQMTRGVILCLVFFVVIFLFVMTKNKPKIRFILFFVIILAILLYFIVFRDILIKTEWYYYIFKLKSGNILNGRMQDYELAFEWDGIIHFIFGHGVGSVQLANGKTSVEYIHNLILHILYEQGIIATIFIIILLFKSVIVIVNNISLNEKLFLLALFSCSIVRLMVSYYFWIDPLFWIYFSHSILLMRRKKSEKSIYYYTNIQETAVYY